MGQNIHLHIEVKHEGQWAHFAAPRVKRNYKLHTLMGGDRDVGIPPIGGIKTGLPADVSPITKVCFDNDTGLYGKTLAGTVRVMNADQITALQTAYIAAQPELSRLDADLEETVFACYINGNAIASHQGFEDVRLVYWFDN